MLHLSKYCDAAKLKRCVADERVPTYRKELFKVLLIIFSHQHLHVDGAVFRPLLRSGCLNSCGVNRRDESARAPIGRAPDQLVFQAEDPAVRLDEEEIPTTDEQQWQVLADRGVDVRGCVVGRNSRNQSLQSSDNNRMLPKDS